MDCWNSCAEETTILVRSASSIHHEISSDFFIWLSFHIFFFNPDIGLYNTCHHALCFNLYFVFLKLFVIWEKWTYRSIFVRSSLTSEFSYVYISGENAKNTALLKKNLLSKTIKNHTYFWENIPIVWYDDLLCKC